MSVFKKIYSWLFSSSSRKENSWEIIKWWETRRIPYNVIVGFFGLLSLCFFLWIASKTLNLKTEQESFEPFALILAILLANFFYTGGWVVELILRFIGTSNSERFGVNAFGVGLLFSILCTMLPTIILLFKWFGVVFAK